MVSRFLIFLFLIFIVKFIYSQSITDFYYYHNQMINLELVPDQISIRFTEDFTPNNVDPFLQGILGFQADNIKPFLTCSDRIVKLATAYSERDMANFLNFLNQNPNIRLASPVYRYKNFRQVVIDEFIVEFKPGVSKDQIDDINQSNNAIIVKQLWDQVYVLSIDKSTGLNGLTGANLYHELDLVEWATPNFIYPEWELLNATVNDPYWSSQWAHKNDGQSVATGAAIGPSSVTGFPDADMDIDLAWDVLINHGGSAGGSANILIAIIDSGVDLAHPDLDDNLYSNGADFSSDGGSTASDGYGHGTGTAGIAAAEGNNSAGVAGVAFRSQILAVKIFNNNGGASGADIAGGIDYAWQQGADILSNSWGGGSPNTAIDNAINRAKTQGRSGNGCVILFSSGNDGNGFVNYPAYLSDVIAVGASNMFDEKKHSGSADAQHWWGGNYGTALDIVAPTIVYTTDITGSGGFSSGDYLDDFNGTSAACPNAAGVAALVLAANPNLTSNQVQTILQNTADKIERYGCNSSGWNKHVGFGRVNAYRALLATFGNDDSYPLMVHTYLQPYSSTESRDVSVDITDNTGIASASGQPRLYYRKDAGSGFGSWYSLTDTDGPAGNTFNFIIPGQSSDTQVQYYIAAQDNSSGNNSGTYPFGGTGINPPGSSPPPNVFTYRAANFIEQSLASSDVPVSIRTGTAISDLNVGMSSIIADLNVLVDINHTYTEDLTITLESPSGTRCGLTASNGGSGNNYSITTFDDEAITPITNGSPPFNGTYQPDNALSVFDGEDCQGQWTLYIYDGYNFNNGTLMAWSLIFSYGDPDNSLPVALTNFSVEMHKGKIRLFWETESELDNLGYIIERRESESPLWQQIASYLTDEDLEGRGNTGYRSVYEYVDEKIQFGKIYEYRLADVSYAGIVTYHNILEISVSAAQQPDQYVLQNAFPNPFNPVTTIRYGIPERGIVNLQIYDTLGRLIRTLVSKVQEAGWYETQWEGKVESGGLVSSGMYIYILHTGKHREVKKMLLIK